MKHRASWVCGWNAGRMHQMVEFDLKAFLDVHLFSTLAHANFQMVHMKDFKVGRSMDMEKPSHALGQRKMGRVKKLFISMNLSHSSGIFLVFSRMEEPKVEACRGYPPDFDWVSELGRMPWEIANIKNGILDIKKMM